MKAALWFNIPEEHVAESTLHYQTTYRWRKEPKALKEADPKEGRGIVSSSHFDRRDSFVMIRPIDNEAFSLVAGILKHRYETARAERIASIHQRSVGLKKVASEESLLRERFANLKRHWDTWTYPSISGRPPIDENTPVPPVVVEYVPSGLTYGVIDNSTAPETSQKTTRMWDSFLSTLAAIQNNQVNIIDAESIDSPCTAKTATDAAYLLRDFAPAVQGTECSGQHERLSVFVRLSLGGIIDYKNRALPHIKIHSNRSSKCFHKRGHPDTEPKKSYLHQSERCWKSLLLPKRAQQVDEWDVILDRFLMKNSRARKVLHLVQV